ncbi:hypothetical protein ABPG77_007766 [Micractinium sp. CCAP 211/92]
MQATLTARCVRPAGVRPSAAQRARLQVCAATHEIAVLSGDGIGPEITAATLPVLTEAGRAEGEEFAYTEAPIGGAAIDATGDPYPASTEEVCKASDAVLLACIGGYKWDTLPNAQRPEKGLLRLRSSLNAFANLRPAVVLPQLADASTLKREVVEGTDILIVRELVGGIYFGEPRGFKEENGERVGFNTMVYRESEIERIARVAFEAAMKRGKQLCSVEKSNVLEVSQLWKEVVTRVAADYPEVELSHMYIDNAAMQLIRNPKAFDTIVTGNIFGDILSDEASMLTGSLGMLPSASISEPGKPGIYEPVHGSAPDIAGQDKANPLAMVLSAAMMCRFGLNLPKVADRLEAAVTAALDAGYRTGDIMQPGCKLVGCQEMGRVVLQYVEQQATAKA